jgi:hypothetical protein
MYKSENKISEFLAEQRVLTVHVSHDQLYCPKGAPRRDLIKNYEEVKAAFCLKPILSSYWDKTRSYVGHPDE